MPSERALLPGIRPVTVTADDGVPLSGVVVPAAPTPLREPGRRALTFVVAHGFTNSVSRALLRPAGWLRPFGEVRALDFRGHGRSAVVTLGLSMVEGPRCPPPLARSRRDPAARPAVVRDTAPMRRVHWLLETGLGRGLVSRLVRLRLDEPWLAVPPFPLQIVSRIAPVPLRLVHGDRDEYFPLEHFRTPAQAAGPTATSWVVPGFGHAESGATAPLVERIGRWASATIDR